MSRPSRRSFLASSTTGALAVALARRSYSNEAAVMPETVVYKMAEGCAIKADVYLPARRPEGERAPVVIWVHGGALIMGDRRGVNRALTEALLKEGIAVISIDYRLAPETKLPEILRDVEDACRWARTDAAERDRLDPDRLAVMGGSAGGYLTLTTGHRVSPRPRALVSFWGYGDITGPWYSRPDPFYRRSPLIPEDEARKAVGTTPLSEMNGPNARSRFYLYCRQNGLWPKEVAGHDPDTEPAAFDPFSPIRNVAPGYPPTMFIHGTRDTDVPYEQSKIMDEELARKGIEHELITVEGGGHGLGDTDPALLAEIRGRAVAFVTRHLRQ